MKRLLLIDEIILQHVRRLELPHVTRLMRILTRVGDASSWTVLGLTLLCSGGNGVRHGALLGAAALTATALAQALKRTCRRPRPSTGIRGFIALAENPDTFSFPSGHTAVAFSVAIALAGEGHGLGPLFWLLATGIGVSRVYLGAHYPLDVGVGVVLGTLAGLLARLMVL